MVFGGIVPKHVQDVRKHIEGCIQKICVVNNVDYDINDVIYKTKDNGTYWLVFKESDRKEAEHQIMINDMNDSERFL